MADDAGPAAELMEAELARLKRALEASRAEAAELRGELAQRDRALTEALEQQTATSEVLRVIAAAPTDLDRVLDAVVHAARRLCRADSATVHEREGDHLRRRAEAWDRLRPPRAPFPGAPSRPITGRLPARQGPDR